MKDLIIVIIGLVFIAFGICLGIYVGLWWAFVGGIMQIVNTVRSPELDAAILAWGVVKVVFASFAGCLAGALPVMVGLFILKTK